VTVAMHYMSIRTVLDADIRSVIYLLQTYTNRLQIKTWHPNHRFQNCFRWCEYYVLIGPSKVIHGTLVDV